MASAKDYLEMWRQLYSFPNHITGNMYLTPDGSQCLNKESDWNYAQMTALLKGNAVGTFDNSYLDPNPLFNKLGQIYTNIINSAFISARTDAIKMNLLNMDFTNGNNRTRETAEVYEFFNFYGYDDDPLVFDKIYCDGDVENSENGKAISQLITTLIANCEKKDDTGNSIVIGQDALGITLRDSVTVLDDLKRYSNWYNNWYTSGWDTIFFKYVLRKEPDTTNYVWDKLWMEIIIKDNDNNKDNDVVYHIPNLEYVIVWSSYSQRITNGYKGLQLLMPQYHRRVEVEDLNKNFWVIAQILDAVVNALWGPYGLIDVVRQLILKVTQIEEFLGLTGITGIDLLYNGNDELYFDMYSRILLSNLQLKLKTQSGERIIKDIFKGHTENVDRNSTTDGYDSREELFFGIQTNEISPNDDEKIGAGILYDSDIISSDGTVDLANGKKFVSLSAVIDAINNNIEENEVSIGSYDYDINSTYKEFFSKFDITPDGTLSPGDFQKITEDILNISQGKILSSEEINRFARYKEAKDFLCNLWHGSGPKGSYADLFDALGIKGTNNEAIDYIENTLFQTKKVLLEISSMTLDNNDDKKISEEEFLKYANEQIEEIRNTLDSIISTYMVEIVSSGNGMSSISSLKSLKAVEESNITNGTFINLKPKDINDISYTFSLLKSHSDYLENYFINTNSVETGDKNPKYFNVEFLSNDKKIIYIPMVDKSGSNQISGLLKINLNTSLKNEELTYIKNLGISINNSPSQKIYYVVSKNSTEQNPLISNLYELQNLLEKKYSSYKYNSVPISLSSVMPIYEYKVNKTGDGGKIEVNGEIMHVEKAVYYNSEVSISKHFSIKINKYNGVSILPSEDIYVYYLNAEKLIAAYLLPDSTINTTDTYKIQSWFKNQTTAETANFFFDINGSGEIDLYDAIEIENNLNYINDANYNKKMKTLRERIDNNENSCVEHFRNLLNNVYNYNLDANKNDTTNKEVIKKFLFTKKIIGSDSVVITSQITTPTTLLLAYMTKLASPKRMINGYEITNTDKFYLLQSTKQMDYKLYGNILIFLYDKDYYEFKWDRDGKDKEIQDDDGLYVKVTDGFYTTAQPIIKYNNFYTHESGKLAATDDTYALFVPRADLIGGEIIQLRLTERGKNKKMLDLNSNTISNDGFTEFITSDSKLFLSLHNSFADNLTQYNHRAALFFDNTVPENVLSEDGSSRPFTNVDDWFCNGIECQYFKPNTLKINEETVIGKRAYKHANLRIKASMICKNEEFRDNSFIFEEGPYDDPSTNDVYYTFARKMAYSGAQRNNLIFYASPATTEDDMFIHSPTQLLVAPSLRKDESIQPPYWEGEITKDEKEELENEMRGSYSVMLGKDSTCKMADIKNMIYRNSLAKEHTPPVIEAVWGMRDVDNYIKKKTLKYIIIEREPGSRNSTYGPNCIDLSCSDGYLHDKNGMKSLRAQDLHSDENCRVKWYDKTGKFINYKTGGQYFPPGEAKYGVIDLTKLNLEETRNFIVRFYSSNLNHADSNSTRFDEFTFQLEENGEYHLRRPIFKMAYFLGIDSTGKSTTTQEFLVGDE